MAHPLTQHPPTVLPFGAPASMHPLGFGFGQPPRQNLGFGFGSPIHSPIHSGASTPYKRPAVRTSPTPIPTPNNKRSRRRSASPTPSPTGSPTLSRADERKILGKTPKRVRKEVGPAEQAADGPDVGLLLASMPPTSHLPILMELLNGNPAMSERVLKSLPAPPLSNVLETLERNVGKIGKAAGTWEPQEGVVAQRRWHRTEEDVSAFVKSANTYLKFFTSGSTGPTEPNTIFHLLHAITANVQQLLALVPSPNSPPPAARPLLNFANALLTAWNQWLGGLSDEVNNRGGMYPHGMVSSWADGLAGLTRAPPPPVAQPTHVSWSMAISAPVHVPESTLVSGFRDALVPVRVGFANSLGWMIR
ncbi:hypothetical protein CcaverHIS002_0607370 [Cutaneotrichosporon cavernicola]|uniref:Cut8-domain-containing protein n=1 Tax=Cutaneotrichosporon cavernicola TaxID=279322 RepID=A0AA48L972_9TREE|nr:uncharacterized protein CcaverHIS019_0606790 [Cutaneotrichosporon cavernicola]BEI86450.1 hypothetical protein CcaverHIS002_0607370 [Cutaneotrichosporon cavernicola]BEI94220.1 hypothetical protein CcaverHIS019_0606790 [Cutaneotrichosporon cavernicola]BEJ02000.1 hypothetical protein CcaverHIS631_0606820 [Cutaneotrichosporon cavernicola]BEJ09763.1 hypothetical protein CcaverHIS641_0606780 [Cutaneotrichosporon cavernicola]